MKTNYNPRKLRRTIENKLLMEIFDTGFKVFLLQLNWDVYYTYRQHNVFNLHTIRLK